MTAMGRPSLHFTARAGWINDPHTLVHHDGVYHLFFQFVPDGTEWRSSCHWGHATSPDLVSWQEHSPALAPGDDEDGCWSGTLVDGNNPLVFYTSIHEPGRELGEIRLARPEDPGWERWAKGATVVSPPAGLDVTFFRDPFLLREDSGWRMLVGAALADGSGAILGFVSEDLLTWAFDGLVANRSTAETEGTWTGRGWECPALLRIDGHDVLLVSVWDTDGQYEAYCVGSLDGGRFVGGPWHRLSYGAYYAGAAFTDADGRPALVHWLRGVSDPAEGWAGAHSLPQLLQVDGDRLLVRPHDLVDPLRRDPAGILGQSQGESGWLDLHTPLDIAWTPGAEGARITVDSLALAVSVSDRTLDVSVGEDHHSVDWEPGETVRIVVTPPVVEVFTRAGIIAGALTTTEALPGLLMTGAGDLRTWRVSATAAG